jgi:hypothetical protein
MKQQRARFKARKKYRNRRNAEFEKLTAGFTLRKKGQVNRNKHRQPVEVNKEK